MDDNIILHNVKKAVISFNHNGAQHNKNERLDISNSLSTEPKAVVSSQTKPVKFSVSA